MNKEELSKILDCELDDFEILQTKESKSNYTFVKVKFVKNIYLYMPNFVRVLSIDDYEDNLILGLRVEKFR